MFKTNQKEGNMHLIVLHIFMFLQFFVENTFGENVQSTEVFEIVIDPSLFNWTHEGVNHQFSFRPSLLDYPDLPSWMNYHYSEKYQAGFLYGTALEEMNLQIQVIGLNRKRYEVNKKIIPIYVTKKANPAQNHAQFKINNLNVEDLFDSQRLERLKDVFRHVLWKNSKDDLYLTFLASAVELGARFPPSPDEGEGVIIKVGSTAPFSEDLLQLEKEVRPLWKHTSCPRDFKRTSVERYFRESGFALDWCTFRLVENDNTRLQPLSDVFRKNVDENIERLYFKEDIPHRNYLGEIVVSFVLPLSVMAVCLLILSLILCIHHDVLSTDSNCSFSDGTFRSVSRERTITCLSNDLNLYHQGNTPNSTMQKVHCRPSPPPYVKPKFKPYL